MEKGIGKKFIWGNYDYSNNININKNNNEIKEEKKGILETMKEKIKKGIEKIDIVNKKKKQI